MRCEKCGSLVDDDANYCDVCGKQLTRNKKGEIKKFLFVSDDLDNTQIKKDKDRDLKILTIIFFLIILLLGVLFVFYPF